MKGKIRNFIVKSKAAPAWRACSEHLFGRKVIFPSMVKKRRRPFIFIFRKPTYAQKIGSENGKDIFIYLILENTFFGQN